MTLKFGELEKVAVDDDFIWYAQLELKSESFGEVPFCLVCKDETGTDDETIASRANCQEYRPTHKRGACLFKR